jgi:glyoxylase-like metal-dependent hydrolase (beta-lactamase superfamily II)
MIAKSSVDISRRHFIASGSLAVAAAWLLPSRLWAQEGNLVEGARKEGATAKLTVQKLRRNVSVLLGAGGNIAVLAGRDGKVLVDAGFATSQQQVSNALKAISPEPMKHLINTHWHFDHTDGNEWMHEAGATIIAHENTREHLSTSTRVEGWNYTFAPSPAGAIPTNVFAEKQTLHLNGMTLMLEHYEPAHTDSDISVHFTDADIFHAGDTWWNGFYPFIDYSTGGSIDGTIRATELNLSKVSDKTIVIPGHGPVGNKSELALFHDVLTEIREKVAALKKEGKSVREVIAAKVSARYDDKWGGLFMSPAQFIGLVYQGV